MKDENAQGRAPFGRPNNYLGRISSLSGNHNGQRTLMKVVKQASALLAVGSLGEREDQHIALPCFAHQMRKHIFLDHPIGSATREMFKCSTRNSCEQKPFDSVAILGGPGNGSHPKYVHPRKLRWKLKITQKKNII